MFTASVIIGHVNTFSLLKLCLACLDRWQHPAVETQVIVVNQSDVPTHNDVVALCKEYDPDQRRVFALPARHIGSGYAIDVGLQVATGSYVCTLDVDAFVTHKNWLLLPIRLIAEGHCAWVGFDTRLAQSYKHKGEFLVPNNYFRVCETDLAKRLSKAVGFMRPQCRKTAAFTPEDTSWEALPEPHSADSGVVAMWYARQIKSGSVISMRRGPCLGHTPDIGCYGDNLDDLALHMTFACSQPMSRLGDGYNALRRGLNDGWMTPDDVMDLRDHFTGGVAGRELDGVRVTDELDALIDKMKAE